MVAVDVFRVNYQLYQINPYAFTDDEVDWLKAQAKERNIPFQRHYGASQFSLARMASQLFAGFGEGFTTLPVGGAPQTEAESIARSVGHLAGFVGFIPGLGAAGKAVGLGTRLAMAARGTGVVSKAAKTVKFTKTGGMFIPSIPMLGGRAAEKAGRFVLERAISKKATTQAGKLAAEYLAPGTIARDVARSAVHLGAASAVSSVWRGPSEIVDSAIHGALFGASFGVLGNFMTAGRLLGSTSRMANARGEAILFNVARGVAGSAITGIPATLGQEPTSVQVYQYLLGGFFGYRARPAHERQGGEFFNKLMFEGDNAKKLDPRRHHPEFKDLVEPAQEYVETQVRKHFGELVEKAGTGHMAVLWSDALNRAREEAGIKWEKPTEEQVQDVARENIAKAAAEEIRAVPREPTQFEFVDSSPEAREVRQQVATGDAESPINPFTPLGELVETIAAKSELPKQQVYNEILDSMSKSLDEAGRVDFDALKKKVAKKYDYMPSEKLGRGLKQFLLRANYDSMQPQWEYDTDVGMRELHEWNVQNKNVSDLSPEKALAHIMQTSKLKEAVLRLKVGKRSFNVVLKPLDQNIYWSPSQNKLMKDDALKPKDWLSLEQSLIKQNMYVLGGIKDKGVLLFARYHPDVRKVGYDLAMRQLQESPQGKNAKTVFNAGLKMYYEQLGVKEGTARARNFEQHYKNMWTSNILYQRDVERLPINKILQAGSIKNAIDMNKRTQIDQDANYPLPAEEVADFADHLGNLNYLILDDIPRRGESLVQGIPHDMYKEVGREAPRRQTSGQDGGIILHSKLFERVRDTYGLPEGGGFIKAMITSQGREGVLRIKGAIHKGRAEDDALMEAHETGAILFKSAAKTIGSRKVSNYKLTDEGYVLDPRQPIRAYNMKPEDIRINMGVFEDPWLQTKDQPVVKQLTSQWNPEQGMEGATKEWFKTYHEPSIQGDMAVNRRVRRYFEAEGKEQAKILEGLKKDLSKIGIAELDFIFDDARRANSDLANMLTRHVMKKGAAGELELSDYGWYQEDLEEVREWYSRVDKEMQTANYDMGVRLHNQEYWEKSLFNYKLARAVRPTIPYSGKAYLTLYDAATMKDIHGATGKKLAPDEFYLNVGWRDHPAALKKRYPYKGEMRTLKEIAEAIEKGEDPAEFLVIRVPSSSISGTRVLKFKGFTKRPGFGLLTHPEADFYLDGADKDGDVVFFYGGVSKTIRDAVRKNANELQDKTGAFYKGKDPKLGKIFRAETDPLFLDPTSKLDPMMLRMTAQGAYRGNKALGMIVNSKQYLQMMLSTVIRKGGKAKFATKSRGGNVYGEVEVTAARDSGKKMRYMGWQASSMSADAADYSQLLDGFGFREVLAKSGFTARFRPFNRETKRFGSWRPAEWRHLTGTELGRIANLNTALYGRNWNANRAWTAEEINEALMEFHRNDIGFPGIMPMVAHAMAESEPNLSPLKHMNFYSWRALGSEVTDAMNPARYPKGSPERAQAEQWLKHLVREEIIVKPTYKDLPAQMELILRRNDLHDIAGIAILARHGNKMMQAASEAGVDPADLEFVQRAAAADVKAIKEQSNEARRFGRKEKQPMYVSMDRVHQDIRDTRTRYGEIALSMGLDPELLQKYFDYYMLSPIFSQEQTFKKFHEALLTEKVNIEKQDMPELERAYAIEEVNSRIEEAKRTWHKTSPYRLGFESPEIPTLSIRDYLKTFGDLFKASQTPVTAKQIREYLAGEPLIKEDGRVEHGVEERVAADLEAGAVLNKARPLVKEVGVTPFDLGKMELKGASQEDFRLVKTLKDYMTRYPNILKPGQYRLFFRAFTAEHELLGREPESMTRDDVRNMIKFFEIIHKGSWLRRYFAKKFEQGDKFPLGQLMSWAFPKYMNEVAMQKEIKLYERYAVPIRQPTGNIALGTIGVPMATMGATQHYMSEINRMSSQHKEILQEKMFNRYDWKAQIDIAEFVKLHDVAARLREKDQKHTEYQKRWKEIEPLYNKLTAVDKEGKPVRMYSVLKEGKEIRVSAEKMINWINEKHTETFIDAREWLYSRVAWDRIDQELKYGKHGKYLEYDQYGKLNYMKALRVLAEPLARGESVPTAGIDLILRIQYEMVLEEQVALKGFKSDKFNTKQMYEKNFREDWRRPKRLIKNPKTGEMEIQRSRTAFRGVGELDPATYWPHAGHMRTRAGREKVMKWIDEQYRAIYQDVLDNPIGANKLTVAEYKEVMSGEGRSLEERAAEIATRAKIKYERMVGFGVKDDAGIAEKAARWVVENPLTQPELERVGFFSRPNAARRRGKVPLPEWSTDFYEVQNYMESLVTGYYRLLGATMAKVRIDDFVKRKPMGKDTARWADAMRLFVSEALGYPTFFPEKVVGPTRRSKGRYEQQLSVKQAERAKETDPERIKKLDTNILELQGRLDQPIDRLKVFKTGYYMTSDQASTAWLDWVSKKFFKGEHILGRRLPEDVQARRDVLTGLVHKFGNLEAKWSLMTLLSHTKTIVNNLYGGTQLTLADTGFRHWKRSSSLSYLVTKVFQGAEIDGKPIRSWADIDRVVEAQGVLESFYVTEAALNPRFKTKEWQAFWRDTITRLKRDPDLPDESLYEIARKYGITKAAVDAGAFPMRWAERRLRRRAALAHYLQAREVLSAVQEEIPWDSPWLWHLARKGVEATQFLYHSAARPGYSRTAIGKVMTRFHPWAWNSIRFRRTVYQNAKTYGFKPGTQDFERLRRILTMDIMAFALAEMFISSIFESALPPPMSWLQDTAAWLYGDERARERAFFSQWPTTKLAPLQPITPPIARFPLSVINGIVNGDWQRFADFHVWTWFPFGRPIRAAYFSWKNPESTLEYWIGFAPWRVRKAKSDEDRLHSVQYLPRQRGEE